MPIQFKRRGVMAPPALIEHKRLQAKPMSELTALVKSRGLDLGPNPTKLEIVNALSKMKGE